MTRKWIVPKTQSARIQQRLGLGIGVLIILFPPWVEEYFGMRLPDFHQSFVGYHLLWAAPSNSEIAISLWLLQLLILALVTQWSVWLLNRLGK
jgi:hypothetical protein